ncbi:hypothetical protein B0T16DRAFT_441862 [Cercophora newfieldiana]|uniref:Uncharacterized protein n=1 Tax=Cercophora newfieldiana TaxID=92897 RepID=A0AA39YR12_9PEZI|nr:hypothetical protein B0T16DRAFT_441862 [Cercophora newfieldiana]
MGLFRLLPLLAFLAPLALGSPVVPAEDTVTSTAATTTAAVTVVPPDFLPPPPLSDLTVWRTRTVTRWSRTTTVVQQLNCTRTVIIRGNNPPARPTITPSRAPPVVPVPTGASVPAILPRQGNSSSITPTLQVPTLIPPPSRITNLPRRTRTSTTTVYVTPTSDLRRTRNECAKTVTYLYIQNQTTTLVRTVTSWPNIVTTTSLIDCLPPGRPRLSTTRLQPTRVPPRPSVSLSRVPPPPPVPSPTVTGVSLIVDKRQGTGYYDGEPEYDHDPGHWMQDD